MGGGSKKGAAGRVAEGRRNEQIYAERLSGTDVSSLVAEHDLQKSQIYQILKDCREGAIEDLELDDPWRAQRFADELLLQKIRAINDAREIELRARGRNNLAVELGAFKARVGATREYATLLEETGRLGDLQDLKPEAAVAELWDAVVD
ncbi:MAG TPA: hypothetical protein VII01_01595, partial [Solirubrobacteraceae bacterium]